MVLAFADADNTRLAPSAAHENASLIILHLGINPPMGFGGPELRGDRRSMRVISEWRK
jgi:hypothetical protein